MVKCRIELQVKYSIDYVQIPLHIIISFFGITNFQDVFHERVKTFQTWQHAQTMLAKKREAKAKAELAGRMDKVQQAQDEVAEVSSNGRFYKL